MSLSSAEEAWDRSPAGLLTLLPDGMIVEANRTFLTWVGRDRDDVIRRLRLSDVLSVGGRIYWETHLSPMLHVERRASEVALELKAPEGRLPVLLTAELEAAEALGGDVIRVAISSARERSRYERELLAARASAERSEAQVRVLQATTAALSQTLGVAAVVDALVASVCGDLGAAAATVWLTAPEGRLTVQAAAGEPPTAADVPSPAVVGQGPVAVEHGNRIVVPLLGQSELQGVLSLTSSTGAGADPLDLEVVTAVGQQAGLALDRARRYEESANVARELQHSLLAVEPPADSRFEIATFYRPGVSMLEVGGDWYDVFVAAPGSLAVVVGDVVGRGLNAASAMGQLRSAVRAVAGIDAGPGLLLSRLDRFVEQVEATVMATVVYAEVELATGSVRHASAGHPPALLLPKYGGARLLWDGRSVPLGALPSAVDRPEAVVRLEPGDRLLLYTDGLVERRERDLDEGLDLLVEAAERVRDLPLADIVGSVTELMLADEVVRDDVCVLLLAWTGSDAAGQTRITSA